MTLYDQRNATLKLIYFSLAWKFNSCGSINVAKLLIFIQFPRSLDNDKCIHVVLSLGLALEEIIEYSSPWL